MTPYFIVLTSVIVLAFLAEKAKRNKVIHHFYVILIFLILVLFAGLRNSMVGSDTIMYASRFENLSFDFFSLMNQKTRIEIGYRLIEYIGLLFSNNYVAILLTTAFVTVYFQLKGIYRVSVMPVISIIILITLGIYTYVFNGARQAVAAAIYTYSIYYLVKGNFKKYALWVFIAFFFHKSVILGLPLYFLFRKSFSFKLLLLFAFGTFIVITFFSILMRYVSLFNEQYAIYQDIEAQGAVYLTLAYVLLSSFFIIIRPKILSSYKRFYDIYLNMFLLGTIVYITVYFTGAYVEMTRIGFYYLLSAMFIWPLIFKSLTQKVVFLPFVFFSIVHITFFYIFLQKMANLSPYILNTQIFN